MTEILRMEAVTKTYHRHGREPVTALRDVDLRLCSGELKWVYGPSGSGKSTLLMCCGGLLHPDRGVVRIEGDDIYRMPPESRSRMRAERIGFVFQRFHLIPYLNVIDNVLAPTLAGAVKTDLRPRAQALIERFGLSSRRDHPPSELSTGERQRVALARALLLEPRLLLADEPTGNLDARNGELVIHALLDFANDGGAVLVVTHDPHADRERAVFLDDGVLRGDRHDV